MPNRMIFVGEKESFIARVLIKKVNDTGISCEFAAQSINDIDSKLEGAKLITLYLDDNTRPKDDVMHFLTDRIRETDAQVIIIGEPADIEYIKKVLPEVFIYREFTRPIDNAQYAASVTDYFQKAATGDLKKSILVVDDDMQYLSLVREWLKDRYKISMANSGLQAIKYLGKNKVDLILLDHEMPVTSGPQVLEMLRSDPETKPIPVIFLTGKSDRESVMEVVALRPEGYFLKTIQKEELLEKLNDFFVTHK